MSAFIFQAQIELDTVVGFLESSISWVFRLPAAAWRKQPKFNQIRRKGRELGVNWRILTSRQATDWVSHRT